MRENVEETIQAPLVLYSHFDECFKFMQVESAIALKLLSGGCSLDMSKVMCSSNFKMLLSGVCLDSWYKNGWKGTAVCLPLYVCSSNILLKNNFSFYFVLYILSEGITL